MLKISDVEPSTALGGLFTDGNVAGGISPTRLVAAWFNALQTELVNVVETSGIKLDPDDSTQVLQALTKMFLNRSQPFADIAADGAAAVSMALANLGLVDINGYAGRLIGKSSFTTSGTYTKTAGARFARVRAVGGGGGGGGVAYTSGQQATAAAGESGSYIEAWVDLSAVTSLTVTIGAPGTGGAAGANAGTDGGSTYLGSVVSCPGGTGGVGGGPSATTEYLARDTTGAESKIPTSTGAVISALIPMKRSYRMVLSLTVGIGGTGGDSPFGIGGRPGQGDAGSDGSGFGAGGGGACSLSTGSASKGGNGTGGFMIIEEYA